ncbi:MAG: NAD(P)/FAD-dependent oxidoreductase [Betaproteobacteria bacterium]|nr:MAG: NAD(P)/FAD-dependent oxidoreductase [Betaproteobacteria bacterium]
MSEAARASHWGIIGGGMLGMTLAHRLARQGKRVTLLEAAGQLGGLASAWSVGDLVWDRHYHVTLLSDAHLRKLLAELDLERDIEWTETCTGVFARGRLHSVSNTLELLRFPVLGWLDVLRLGATILWASRLKNWRRLEDITVAEWLTRWSGRGTFERFWLPLLRSKLGEAYTDTSAAFIWATIQRLYAARRSGMKKEMFGTVRGGYARVLERFAASLAADGVRLRLNAPVRRVAAAAAGGGVQVTCEDGGSEAFDHVVVTAAAPIAARLCAGLSGDEMQRLAGVRYLGIVCASVLLRQPLAGYYVTNLLDPGLPFTGVIEMSALVRSGHFGGRGLVYLPRYLAPEDPFFDMPDTAVEALFLEGLMRVYPAVRREDVLAFRISRVRHVMPLPTLGYSQRVPPTDTSVPGLHLVNSAHILNGTLNVNETVLLAERVAARFAAIS